MTPVHPCPKCGCEDTTRFHRKSIERLLIVLRPYRCFLCDHKFYTLTTFPNLSPILHELACELNPFREISLRRQPR